MSKLIQKFKQFWPIGLYALIVLILFKTNYVPGTYLTGWDNLHPEFNFLLNIKRSIFAVWQEYQSMGLLGGMGHATDLIRQLFLYMLSLVIPPMLLRYTWTFLMLFVGASGAYVFIKQHFFPKSSVLPFLGGLFYLLNLATMQTFYVPFESFIGHFGFLPWMLWAGLLYFQEKSWKHLGILLFTLLLSTPQAYIPTLFVVYMIALTILIGTHLFYHREKEAYIRAFKLYLLIFLVNAFWLLPFLYFTATSANVNLHSKINQMATQTIFLQNKEFGTIPNVAILKGFWFNNVEPDSTGNYVYMLKPWINHMNNPLSILIAYGLFAIVLTGVILCWKRKTPLTMSLVLLFLFCLTALSTATPPFSWINTLFRTLLPILDQAFRFPFTKFSLLTGFVYAILFTIGVAYLKQHLESRIQHLASRFNTYFPLSYFSILIISILFIALPAFQGHLLYYKERLQLPDDYKKVFGYFNTQSPNTRIAYLPQQTYWGWNFYDWGYSGSGFLWYGLPQSISDRAFDVWSETSENYYFEISQAIYAKDTVSLVKVLQKYNISYIIFDEHVVYPPAPKSLFYKDLEQMLSSTHDLALKKTFGKIRIYTVTLPQKPNNYISSVTTLPVINNYHWTSNDAVYNAFGNYSSPTTNKLPPTTFPFRSLFANKSQKDIAFTTHENDTTISFSSTIPQSSSERTLLLPSLSEKEHILPLIISEIKGNTSMSIQLSYKTPEVWIDTEKVYGAEQEIAQFTLALSGATRPQFPLKLNVNGVTDIPITDTNGYITTSFLTLTADNSITLTDATGKAFGSISLSKQTLSNYSDLNEQQVILPAVSKNQLLSVILPKVTDPVLSFTTDGTKVEEVRNCDSFRKGSYTAKIQTIKESQVLTLSSKNATACTAFYAANLLHNEAYVVFLNTINHLGRGFHFWIENIDEGEAPIDTYLESGTPTVTDNTFILPPMEQYGKAYAFHLDNIAIGSDTTENSIKDLSVAYIPYAFLTQMYLSDEAALPKGVVVPVPHVTHPNESLYTVTLSKMPQTVTLAQSYHPVWKAYLISRSTWAILNSIKHAFPFFFGKELQTHLLINNWANGWTITNSELVTPDPELVIVFLPQYLEYAGFGILIILGIYLLWKKIKKNKLFLE